MLVITCLWESFIKTNVFLKAMEEKAFSEILAVSAAIAERGKVEKLREQSREIAGQIAEKKSGVFIIAGLRGSGKTTILSELLKNEKDGVFLNAEATIRYGESLLDMLHYAHSKGYKTFFIDEIHAFPDWEKDVKLFFDETRAKIVISGSSAISLKVKGSELSRRASFFETKPLSFREYLFFTAGKLLPKATIEEIINPDKRKAIERSLIPYLNYFPVYLNFDALPAAFFEKNKEVYTNIIERTIRYDMLYLRDIDVSYVDNTFRVIKVLSTSPPGEISYSGLSSSLGLGMKMVREIIDALAKTGLVYKVMPYGTGKRAVRKEDKILMPLSFRSALCSYYGVNPLRGALREDFFIQHTGSCCYIKTGVERRTPDFVIGNRVFEIGGPSKGYEQIKDKKDAFIVKEGLCEGNREIPLYLFGLLY